MQKIKIIKCHGAVGWILVDAAFDDGGRHADFPADFVPVHKILGFLFLSSVFENN